MSKTSLTTLATALARGPRPLTPAESKLTAAALDLCTVLDLRRLEADISNAVGVRAAEVRRALSAMAAEAASPTAKPPTVAPPVLAGASGDDAAVQAILDARRLVAGF